MAIFDVLFEFSDAQAITGDAQSTDVLDWGSGMEDLDIGIGTPLYVNVLVTTTFAGGTSLAITLYSHTAATSIESGNAHWTSRTFLQAALTAGTPLLSMTLPPDIDEDRYIGLYYNDTGAFTSGTVDAWLGLEPIGQLSPNTQVAPSNI